MALTNLQIYTQLSDYMSKDFKDRVPELTQQNMAQVGETIQSYPTLANEFVEVLTNQVLRTMFLTRNINNPLAFFERGDLSKFGKSLEMVYVDLISGKDFTERFGTGSYENEYLAPESVNNVKVQYLTENSRLKYKVTISNDMLASAFKNQNGLSTMVNQLVSKMHESYNLDKFLMTWRLIDEMNKVEIATGTSAEGNTITPDDGKKLLRKIKKTIKDMGFPSRDYNTSHVWTVSKPSDLAIIMDTEMTSMLDVDVLAGIFNLSKVEMASRIIEIPKFGDDKTQAIILDRDKLQIYSTKYASDTVKNGAGLFTNVFMHRWDLLGACDFANCVRLSKTGAKAILTRSMPYDVMERDIIETEMEVKDGEVATKKEKKKPAKKAE